MGYEHYWYRPPVISDEIFQAICSDFQKLILPMSEMGVPIVGWDGEGEPELNDDDIRFNGPCNCGHPYQEYVSFHLPDDTARGVGPAANAIIRPSADGLGEGLRHRCCGGQCCHEAFCFPKRVPEHRLPVSDQPHTLGLCCYWSKTAFKPYDIAVTATLVIARRHLHDRLVVHSSGLDMQWADAKELCQRHLGYGDGFGIVEHPIIEITLAANGAPIEREVRLRVLEEIDQPVPPND
jgi:hypothetical protein